MMDFPSWFMEAVQKRLEAIYVQSQRDHLILMERVKFSQVFQAFMSSLTEEMRLESLEKEWIYAQGMRDGVQLLLPLVSQENKSKN